MQVNDKSIFSGCQRVTGVFSGFDGQKIISGPLRCNSWSCPTCSPVKKSKLRKRLLNGPMALEGVTRYGQKFLTLTFGGLEQREPYILHDSFDNPVYRAGTDKYRYDTEKMYEIIIENFNRLITAIRKHYGKFRYFRVFETHLDGVPHLHLLLVGKNIAPKSILDSITNLWSKYGMGFVKLNTIKDKSGREIKHFFDLRHAINYMCKYLTKDMIKPGYRKRVFSCSRESLLKIDKKVWQTMRIIMGGFDDNGNIIEKPLDDWDLQEILAGRLIKTKKGFDIQTPDLIETIMNRHLNTLIGKKEKNSDVCDN